MYRIEPRDAACHARSVVPQKRPAEARDPTVNLMPTNIELVKARATLGETVARLREVFGRYVEKPVF